MKTTNRINFLMLALLAGAQLVLVGCASRYYDTHELYAPKNAYSPVSYASTPLVNVSVPATFQDSTYECSDSANVIPDYDWNVNGSGYFFACYNKSNPADLKIFGHANQSINFCVFPAQYYDAQHVYAKPDVTQTGYPPLVRCVNSSEEGVALSFVNDQISTMNAVFIVAAKDKNAMQNCLGTQDYYACPHYSFGVYR